MDGEMKTNHQPYRSSYEDDEIGSKVISAKDIRSALQPYFSVFVRFPSLEDLRLPASHEFNLGFDGGAWCGNAYDGAEGRAYGRTIAQESAELTEAVGEAVYEALPGLKTFRIGGQSPNIISNEAGVGELVWPWTGRMEEYTLDIWPM